MVRRTLAVPVLVALLAGLAACGENGAPAKASAPCGLLERYPSARELHLTLPVQGLFWGQEIWISWFDAKAEGPGYRYPRTRERALDLARELCQAVHDGADLGDLARQHSNGDGGRARGFTVVPHPSRRAQPDARDRALIHTPVGELTPLLEWNGGFWFARRVTAKQGRELAALYEQVRATRARVRIIHIHHAGAHPHRFEFDDFTKEQAVEKAWALVANIQAGAKFEDLAREHSNDEDGRARGGLQITKDPTTGEPTEWIRWGDRNYPQALLDVFLEQCPPGKLWPKPVIHGRGVSVVKVLERKP